MKTLLLFLFFILSTQLNAQEEGAGNFYLHFWQPYFNNPSAQPIDSLILINSGTSWNPIHLNLVGGVAIPLKKSKTSIGLNYFSFHRFYYQTNEAGIFINKKLNFKNGIDISLGAGADYRSQSNFVRESYTTILTGDTIEQGYYNENSIKINLGFTIYWKSIYFGLSCKNCDQSGYDFNISGDRIGSTENARKTIFQGGYILQINNHAKIRIDALLKNAGYESIFDTSVSSFFKNKYYFGFSMRNKFLANTAFHAGIKWKNFWLLGVYERSNRYDKSAFELAAQLQILKNK